MQDNILIAEFMGFWEVEKGYFWDTIQDKSFSYYDLTYSASWDWLMPVLDKCSRLYETLVQTNNAGTTKQIEIELWMFLTNDIEAVYKAVIEFIKWYNTQI